jgi:hypothetical protein
MIGCRGDDEFGGYRDYCALEEHQEQNRSVVEIAKEGCYKIHLKFEI